MVAPAPITGTQLWSFHPQTDSGAGYAGFANRGVASGSIPANPANADFSSEPLVLPLSGAALVGPADPIVLPAGS